MKIEKLNDNQIRCTLTSADLANRKIKLSELAYGTEKARNLFQDMMVEANEQFGFNYDNAPLMVEAIPVAPDSIVLIITKVDDPQELDTRFSKFAPSSDEGDSQAPVQYSGADDIIDLFQKIYEARTKSCFRRERRCGSSRKGCPCGSCPYLPFSFAGRSHLFSKRTESLFLRKKFSVQD